MRNKKVSYTTHAVCLVTCLAVLVTASAQTQGEASKSRDGVAPTPPMGWNSFDAYDCRINEREFRTTVDFMADHLLEYGWEYAVIDYIWWHPEPGNWDTPRRKGHPNIRYKDNGEPLHPEYITMDGFGRLLPSVERFPSSADGQGFKPLADYVHGKGLKFGIHIMRGIHRYAAFLDTPIKDTPYSAKDIAEPWDTCAWCNHMRGVDATRPGAQAYYNSLFELYAQWGVDFIKADDTMFPPYHKGEIEMMRKAIDHCQRPMVLSLSCGEAPLSRADHLKANANMWRISGDFWDNWESLEHNFDLLNAWSPHIGINTWPDADMIPLGRISLDDRPHGPERMTQFTVPEQYTLMTLWSMAKSPLMLGADLLSIDDQTMRLLTNPEVIAVNQHSVDNRQVVKRAGACVWIATNDKTEDRYVALFNMKDVASDVTFDLEWEALRGQYALRDVWARKDVGTIEKKINARLPAHGAALYRLSEKQDVEPIEVSQSITKSHTVEQLRTHYSGEITEQGHTVTFQQSGEICFDTTNRGFIWDVPPEISHIIIGDGVTVNGALHIHGDCTIEGVDRERSGFFGTHEQNWPKDRGIKAYQICTIQGYGDGTLYVKNLTFKNPRGFHIRGGDSPCHVNHCDFLETRPGWGNHSDGFEGGPGSTIDQCHFDSGDDIIKVYHDVTVTNTTIVMGQNSVPIQLGWGSYGSGARGVFRNVKVYGTGGRGPNYPVIAARQGEYKKTLVLEHCSINNPSGSLFHFYDARAHVHVTIDNSPIQLKAFGPVKARTEISINGASYDADATQSCWDMPTVRVTGCDHTLPVMKRVSAD